MSKTKAAFGESDQLKLEVSSFPNSARAV